MMFIAGLFTGAFVAFFIGLFMGGTRRAELERKNVQLTHFVRMVGKWDFVSKYSAQAKAQQLLGD